MVLLKGGEMSGCKGQGVGERVGSFGPLGGVCWEQQSISMVFCAWQGGWHRRGHSCLAKILH